MDASPCAGNARLPVPSCSQCQICVKEIKYLQSVVVKWCSNLLNSFPESSVFQSESQLSCNRGNICLRNEKSIRSNNFGLCFSNDVIKDLHVGEGNPESDNVSTDEKGGKCFLLNNLGNYESTYSTTADDDRFGRSATCCISSTTDQSGIVSTDGVSDNWIAQKDTGGNASEALIVNQGYVYEFPPDVESSDELVKSDAGAASGLYDNQESTSMNVLNSLRNIDMDSRQDLRMTEEENIPALSESLQYSVHTQPSHDDLSYKVKQELDLEEGLVSSMIPISYSNIKSENVDYENYDASPTSSLVGAVGFGLDIVPGSSSTENDPVPSDAPKSSRLPCPGGTFSHYCESSNAPNSCPTDSELTFICDNLLATSDDIPIDPCESGSPFYEHPPSNECVISETEKSMSRTNSFATDGRLLVEPCEASFLFSQPQDLLNFDPKERKLGSESTVNLFRLNVCTQLKPYKSRRRYNTNKRTTAAINPSNHPSRSESSSLCLSSDHCSGSKFDFLNEPDEAQTNDSSRDFISQSSTEDTEVADAVPYPVVGIDLDRCQIEAARRFKCRYCDRRYKLKRDASRHMKSHMFGKLSCPHCEKEYSRRDALSKHLKVSHSGF